MAERAKIGINGQGSLVRSRGRLYYMNYRLIHRFTKLFITQLGFSRVCRAHQPIFYQ